MLIPKAPELMKCELPLISPCYKFCELYSPADAICSRIRNSCCCHTTGLEESCARVRKVQIGVGLIKIILIYLLRPWQSWLLPQAPASSTRPHNLH